MRRPSRSSHGLDLRWKCVALGLRRPQGGLADGGSTLLHPKLRSWRHERNSSGLNQQACQQGILRLLKQANKSLRHPYFRLAPSLKTRHHGIRGRLATRQVGELVTSKDQEAKSSHWKPSSSPSSFPASPPRPRTESTYQPRAAGNRAADNSPDRASAATSTTLRIGGSLVINTGLRASRGVSPSESMSRQGVFPCARCSKRN